MAVNQVTLRDDLIITGGAVAPEGNISAPVGSVFLHENGGPSTVLYVKESGSGNTGWAAVASDRPFATRAAMVTAWSAYVSAGVAPPVGTVWTADGLSYEYDGSTTDISDMSGWKPLSPITPNHFSDNTTPGTTDMTDAINAAIAYVGSLGGGDVYINDTNVAISDSIVIGSGGSGTSSYNNVRLWGRGSAYLDTNDSGTEIKWIGSTDSSAWMLDIQGRGSGLGGGGFYLNADDKAGNCVRVASVYQCILKDILGLNFTHKGIYLTIQDSPPNSNWYSSFGTYDRCTFISSSSTAECWVLDGENATEVNGIWGNTFTSCRGAVTLTADQSAHPAALWLGYCDNNAFFKCDFTTQGITADHTDVDISAMATRNGSATTDGAIIHVRQGLNALGSDRPGTAHSTYYTYDAGSSATADDFNIVEPADGNGRFLRYQGSSVALNADERDAFPQNNTMTACVITGHPAVEDVTSGANEPGRSADNIPAIKFLSYQTADYADIPASEYVSGFSESGVHFGPETFEVRGDERAIAYTQANEQRRVKTYLQSLSADDAEADNDGFQIVIEERDDYADAWTEAGRFKVSREGGFVPESLDSAPAQTEDGLVVYADGSSFDPLNQGAGSAAYPYLVRHDGTDYKPIAPGQYLYSFTIGNNAASTIVLPDSSGWVDVEAVGSSSRYGTARFASNYMDEIQSGSNLAFTTGVLTGTDGAAQVNVSVDGSGNMYVENQTGGNITVAVHLRTRP